MRLLVLTFLFLGLGACGQRSFSDAASDYQVKFSNLVTEKTSESRYEALGQRAESYRITGNVVVSEEAVPSGNGILFLQFSETTGFNDIGDRPQFIPVPIMNGKGELKLDLSNFSIPIDKTTTPPKIVFKDSFFDSLIKVVQRDELPENDSAPSEPTIVLRQNPITVTTKGRGTNDGTYVGHEDVIIEAAGALKNKSFALWAVKTTLEHPNPTEIGDSVIVSAVVLEGATQERNEIYLGLAKEFNSETGKTIKRPVPSPPKYKYEVLGIREGGLVKVSSK